MTQHAQGSSSHRNMACACTRRAWAAWILVVLGGAVPSPGQTLTPAPERVAWPLVDFVTFGDSIHGVQLLASPNLRSRQGRDGVRATTMTLAPIQTRRWVNSVAALVDSVSRVRRQDRTAFMSVPLVANLGHGWLSVGMDGKGSQKAPFFLAVVDSVNRDSVEKWSVAASATDLLLLLTALDGTAQESGFDSLPRAAGGHIEYLSCQLDRRPQLRKEPRPEYPPSARWTRQEGRVLAEFVIDSSGAVRAETFRVLLSDGDDFASAARKAVARAAFVPGEAHGQPVSTRVWQWFVFRMSS